MTRRTEHVDAVVVGAGVNGLVATSVLADHGWDVLLLEGSEDVGGAVRSARRGDSVVDLYSAFYPLAAASPVLRSLDLHQHGLRWSRAPAVVAHTQGPDDAVGAVIEDDVQATAAGLDAAHTGDGQRWLQLVAEWRRMRTPLMQALLGPWPPVAAAARLARILGLGGAIRTARLIMLPVTTMGRELFGGEAPRQLLLGNSLHADIPPSAAGSGAFGWLLCMLAQDVGYPVPVGGAGALTHALRRRAEHAGGRVETGTSVEKVHVRGGRAVGVRTSGGREITARRAVLATTDAVVLLRDLVGLEHLPASVEDGLRRFERDLPTLKVNWNLPRRVPWTAANARRAGTVHVGDGTDAAVRWAADLESGRRPQRPFLVVGQMALSDPSQAPQGHEVLWAYTHLPRGLADAPQAVVDRSARRLADRVAAVIERQAPGALDGATDVLVQVPGDLEHADPSLVRGGVNGGTAQLHQQIFFRPFPGGWGPRLPVEGLYLAGAGAHPGGGVHGACGNNAARAALRDARPWAPLVRPASRALTRRLLPVAPSRLPTARPLRP